MQQLVVLCGLQILWLIDVGHAEYLLVCHSARIVSKKVIITGMISICSSVKQEVPVTAETHQ